MPSNAGLPMLKELRMEQKLKITVFIDFDNIEIGVKSTLHREFDVAAVLDALKERGEIVTKFAYANWRQQERPQQQERQQQDRSQQRPPHKRVALDLVQAMPLVERALGVLERREVRPQLGLLKSTMLQLDSTFNEKAYGASSFTDFVEKLQKADFVEVTGGEGRYMIRMKGGGAPEKPGAKPEEAIPMLRDVLETHRFEVDNGALAEELAEWVRQEQPKLDWRQFGFQEFSELLNYAQD